MIFKGIDEEHEVLLRKLLEKINIKNSDEFIFEYEKGADLTVEKNGNKIKIIYANDSQLFRSLLLSAVLISKNKDGKVCEKAQFENMGIMLDMSRAGVMKVEKVKEYIEYMALCGLNSLMLYMEDVYEVCDLKYFGYLRGRYSEKELMEIDDYGRKYNVEVIPCIQTLGHFEQYIKNKEGRKISDTLSVIMPGKDESYEFIEKLISTVSRCFKTRKIHIGMDEAWGMGTGNYLKENGYRNGTEIFCEHINKVKAITDKYNLEPMIWSDMYFRLSSKSGGYYDESAQIPEYVKEMLPENVSITYWDYYNTEKENYSSMIRRHKKITDKVVFAGGIWTWAGHVPDYLHTLKSTNSALNACKEEKISTVYATVWGDDGCETDAMFSLVGCLLYGEHSYNLNIDENELNSKIELLFGAELSDFTDMSYVLYPLDEYKRGVANLRIKQIIYNDIMCGLLDADIMDEKLITHYLKFAEKYEKLSKKEGYYKEYFKYIAIISKLASDKIEVTQKLHYGYKNDKNTLISVRDELLPQLKKDFEELKDVHYNLWNNTYRPFGFEIVDGRYGIKIERIKTAIRRLDEYLNGKVDRLTELEEERLSFLDGCCLSASHSGIVSAYLAP